MKSRRTFLRKSSLALLAPSFIQSARLNKPAPGSGNAVVRQTSEGETYFVRENTPITIYLSKKTDQIETASLCTEQILPGNGIAVHKHLNEDEVFYFISGKGVIMIDDKETAVWPGSVAFVPKGTWHGLRNIGSDNLSFSFGYSPAGFEDFFRQIGTPKNLPFVAKSKEEIQHMANGYGMVYK